MSRDSVVSGKINPSAAVHPDFIVAGQSECSVRATSERAHRILEGCGYQFGYHTVDTAVRLAALALGAATGLALTSRYGASP